MHAAEYASIYRDEPMLATQPALFSTACIPNTSALLVKVLEFVHPEPPPSQPLRTTIAPARTILNGPRPLYVRRRTQANTNANGPACIFLRM